ncbi:exported hypothetical protein [Candidatus Glomeribacter gigasporarum BEG34]|uniref:Uncharacterized protein n=1 Tax=Candidatus Glomeribacter gigasporarum BEG34 TaxID=1070319 RepID=G2J822_9BURK|nr:hypothetical protein [Candidatus Glomeribacter gigasporarum]CCD28919.1 exported hypothetical protein [Candidatus Glomeribacter gigasporarum BEG34]
MKMKKIAAAVLGSSLGLSAVPSFAAKTAILKVYMDAPVPQACDITLNGQRTASAQLGRVDFSQPDTIMSRDVRVQIRCNENRVAKLRLSDDRLGTIDPGSIPSEEELAQLDVNIEAPQQYFMFSQRGARQFGGFYEMTSSNWTYRVEDPASKEIGEPAAAIMVDSANNQLNALDKLARDTGYAFISDTENADPNQSVSAKIFEGVLTVQSKARRVLQRARGQLNGQVKLEASYL